MMVVCLRTRLVCGTYAKNTISDQNWWCNKAMYAANRYLGLGMRYEAGICTIVISMNGAFQ